MIRRGGRRVSEYQASKTPFKKTARYKRTTDYGEDWPTASKKCLERAGYRCEERKNGERCNRKTYTVHHIVPRSKGGTNAQFNLKAVCSKCHEKKHSHLRGRS